MNEENRQGTRPTEGRSLRDLFDAARKDERPSLLERRDAEDLIRNSETTVLHRLDLRHSWVRRNLLSSPIRIGVTLMTTSAFASLMAIAVSHFTSTAPPATVHAPRVAPPVVLEQPAIQQHRETVVARVAVRPIAPAHSEAHLNPAQLPGDFTATVAYSDTLNAVELNPDQLARLGVDLPDNGDIVVYYPNAKGQAKSWRFTTRGQLSQGSRPPENNSVLVRPLPYAITYPMGEALMYSQFAPHGQKPDVLIGMTPAVAKKYSSQYAELRGERPSDFTHFGISTDVGDSSNGTRNRIITEVQTNAVDDAPSLILQPGAPLRINDNLPPPPPPSITTAEPSDSIWHRGVKQIKVSSSVKILSDGSPGNSSMHILCDTLKSDENGVRTYVGNVNGTLRDSDISIVVNTSNQDADNAPEISANGHRMVVRSVLVDSDMKFGELPGWFSANDSLSSMVKQFASQMLNGDSVRFLPGVATSTDISSLMSNSPELAKLLRAAQCDSMMKSMGRIEVGVAIKADSGVSFPKSVAGISIPKFPIQIRARSGRPMSSDSEARSLEHFYRNESGDTTSWSSLIPIRVTNYNTPEHHTLIFWYERTPEVMNIVPRSAVERADARPKNVEISVYPNPTSGETNVHYIVKNGEPVTINVVSLLGQKLIEGGSRLDQHGDLSLDLSSLEPGVYLLIATLQNGEKAVERVVVTK